MFVILENSISPFDIFSPKNLSSLSVKKLILYLFSFFFDSHILLNYQEYNNPLQKNFSFLILFLIIIIINFFLIHLKLKNLIIDLLIYSYSLLLPNCTIYHFHYEKMRLN